MYNIQFSAQDNLVLVRSKNGFSIFGVDNILNDIVKNSYQENPWEELKRFEREALPLVYKTYSTEYVLKSLHVFEKTWREFLPS